MNSKTVQNVNVVQSEGFAFMLSDEPYKLNDDTFLLDSGASDHLINNVNLFDNYVNLATPIRLSVAKNNTYITATKIGVVKLMSENQTSIILENVLYSEEVPNNLISVKRMRQAGITVEFNPDEIKISKNGQVILITEDISGLPKLKKMFTVEVCDDEFDLWHRRLGHISSSKFLEISKGNLFSDTTYFKNLRPNNKICEACLCGKETRLKYQKEKNKDHIDRPLYVIHTDVCGPITPCTVDEKNYYVVFVDDFTHYCITYLISRKSEVFNVFKDFVAKSQAHFNLKIVHLYCDNGREYLSNEMKSFCVENGTSYHLTVPHTPQLNGVAERMIRYITEKARAMVHGAEIGKEFWGEAVLTATYLINRSPSKALKNKNCTPYELWHKKKPVCKYLKIFGSTVYIHNKTRENKFDTKSWKGILVGYMPNSYKVWDVEEGKFITARDVVIDEKTFLITRPVLRDGQVMTKNSYENNEAENVKENGSKQKKNTEPEGNKVEESGGSVESELNKRKNYIINDKTNEQLGNDDIRRSKRIKNMQPVFYNEDDGGNNSIFNAEIVLDNVPNSFDEINIREDKNEWQKAINDELRSLNENDTWYLVDKPIGKNIVDCKWIFTIKTDEYGNPIRHKARLVARGFTQEYLIDYNETFAPVARITSLRFILAFSNQFELIVHQMDVKTAFLNGILEEEIYMKVPQGLPSGSNKVCKLNKAIYGLKQASRCWYATFEQALKSRGFQNSAVDHCIYILDCGDINKNIYVLLYVDDVVIATKSIATMNSFKTYLNEKFRMTDLNEIKFFIGIKIERCKNKISLSQSAYIMKILKKFKMDECKTVNTPLPSKLNFEELNSEENYDAPCRNLLGCLMYLMLCTRPDISTAVSILSRFTNKNNKELWQCLKRILRYLKGTINLKLEYEKGDYENILAGYVDSDWGGADYADKRSTTGFLFKVFDRCTISWNTKRQVSVAASSTEAEYMALFEAVREALWLRSLCKTINFDVKHETVIYEDNQGCISIANNPVCHKRSKHIDIKFHFTREQIMNKIIRLEYIPTENQLADILTKPMAATRFQTLRCELNLK